MTVPPPLTPPPGMTETQAAAFAVLAQAAYEAALAMRGDRVPSADEARTIVAEALNGPPPRKGKTVVRIVAGRPAPAPRAGIVGAADVPAAIASRPKRKSGLCASTEDGRRQISQYHARRHASRPSECINPDGTRHIYNTACLVRDPKPRKVWNPETDTWEQAEGTFRLNPKMCAAVPLFGIATTTLTPRQRIVYLLLFVSRSVDLSIKKGIVRVATRTQSWLASHCGCTERTIRRDLDALRRHGFLQAKSQERDQRGRQRPSIYYLAKQEREDWMYPLGSQLSARHRLQAHVLFTHDSRTVDWEALVAAKKKWVVDSRARSAYLDRLRRDRERIAQRTQQRRAAAQTRPVATPGPLGPLLSRCLENETPACSGVAVPQPQSGHGCPHHPQRGTSTGLPSTLDHARSQPSHGEPPDNFD